MTIFKCERFQCTLSLDACRKRRKLSGRRTLKWSQAVGVSCKGCQQWRKVKDE